MGSIFITLKKKYSALTITKKAVIWFILATIIQNGILFLVTPLYTRILSDSEYGVFSIYQSWQQIISIVSILALDRCIPIGLTKFSKDRNAFLSSIQVLMTILIVICCCVVLIFPNWFQNLINLPLSIIFTMLIVALLNSTLLNWSWLQRYEYNYKKLTFITIFSTLFMQLVGVVAVFLVPTENKGFIMIMAISSVRLVVYGILYLIVLFKGKVAYKKDYWKFGLKYSIAVIPHALSQIILNSSDRIMIDKMCGREEAAYYGVTYSLAMALNIVITSISSSVQPWFFEKIKEKDYLSIRKNTNMLLMIPAILSFGISLFAPEILAIMAPSTYNSALYVFPSIAASVFFNNLFLYFANFESYYEKPIYFSIATTLGAVINVILNFVLLPIFGFIVAGYTTLICYIIFSIMHYIFMKKVCKINNINEKIFDMKFIIVLSIIVIVMSLGITILYKNSIIRYIIIGMVVIIGIVNQKAIINRCKALISMKK